LASDTIFALASARGRAGVAVLRVSGPRAHAVCQAIAGRLPPLRRATLCTLRAADGLVLDQALVVSFAAGASFTGEDVAEFMLHGALATIAAVETCLTRDHGLRMAEPGEFTRRALENGVLDLTQVEGLADLLDAETETQRRQALRVLDGQAGRVVEGWRAHLLKAAALLEATIDFADEDIGSWDAQILSELRQVADSLAAEVATQQARERIRTGFEVALVGSVNAGKSTLLNALAGREAAITSDIAGTTRDVIEVRMDIAGMAVTFLDTAGLRDDPEQVEAIGIARGRARADGADLRIILCDGPFLPPPVDPLPDDIVLFSKADLYPGQAGGISGVTGQGVADLIARIAAILSPRVPPDGIVIRHRHAQAMQQALDPLQAAIERIATGDYIAELCAADIRAAMTALDVLIGRIDVEDLLGDIFSSFCIGK
jgi:tRNA modification GTPase